MDLNNLRQLIREELTKVMNEGNTLTLKNLTLNDLPQIANSVKMVGIDQNNVNLPWLEGAMFRIDLNSDEAQNNLDYYKSKLVDELGSEILDAPIKLDPSEVWYKKAQIESDLFDTAKERANKLKSDYLKGEREAGRTSGLD
jgi:hypothetical protein